MNTQNLSQTGRSAEVSSPDAADQHVRATRPVAHPTEWLHASTALAWPAFALITFLLLRPTLAPVFHAFLQHVDEVKSIEISGVKLTFDRRSLPVPTPAIARAVGQLSSYDIEELLKHSYDPTKKCRQPPPRLQQNGFIAADKSGCGVMQAAGAEARIYLFKLIAAQVSQVGERVDKPAAPESEE